MKIPIHAALIATMLVVSPTLAAPPAPGAVHVRGTVQSFKGGLLTVKSGPGSVLVRLALKAPVASLIPTDRSRVKEGSFLGIASVPGPGGVQQAREVVVFPEAARGTGEGSYDWDLPGAGGSAGGHSRMTNGTVSHSRMTNGVAHLTSRPASHSRMTNGTVSGVAKSEVTLEFKNGTGKGTQKLTLPAGIPFVTFEPGHLSQLTPGAHVFVIGHRVAGGVIAADRILVGKNGLVPPM